jgi:hypothetical protein
VQSRSMVLKKNTKVNQGVGDGGIIYWLGLGSIYRPRV